MRTRSWIPAILPVIVVVTAGFCGYVIPFEALSEV